MREAVCFSFFSICSMRTFPAISVASWVKTVTLFGVSPGDKQSPSPYKLAPFMNYLIDFWNLLSFPPSTPVSGYTSYPKLENCAFQPWMSMTLSPSRNLITCTVAESPSWMGESDKETGQPWNFILFVLWRWNQNKCCDVQLQCVAILLLSVSFACAYWNLKRVSFCPIA